MATQKFRTLALSLLAFTALHMSAWAGPGLPRYRVVDLGTLGGIDSASLAINSHDQVAGWADTADGQRHAFLYSAGVMQDLGTLIGGVDSYATAVNEAGQVAGYSSINAFGPQFPEIYQGFIWDGNGMRSLGALFCPCSFNDRYGKSNAYGVNDQGWVVGDSGTVRGNSVAHAMLWRDGDLQDLGGGAGAWPISRLFGINDDGIAVGDYAPDGGRQQVFDRQASLWQGSTRISLGTLPGDSSSTALAVNPGGAVVGWSGTYDGAHAFLWRAGRMFDLNESIPEYSGWVLDQASGINRRGDIVGTGIHDGQAHAFLLLLVADDDHG